MLVLGAATLLAVEQRAPEPSAKLDQAVTSWNRSSQSGSIRVLIRTRPGAAPDVLQRLQGRVASVRVSTSPDLLMADLSHEALASVAGDQDVLRVSSDAPVLGKAAEAIGTDPTNTTTTAGATDSNMSPMLETRALHTSAGADLAR